MANATVFVRSLDDMTRVGETFTLYIDCFIMVVWESIVQRFQMDIAVLNFVPGTFKNRMSQGITDWVTSHIGDTVTNIIMPDFVPL